MKVTVIGNGNVGKAVFRELQNFREINELALVGRNAAACLAEAEDYYDAIPLRVDVPAHIMGGGYELAKDSDILIYCAGPSIKAGCTDRQVIAQENIKVMKAIFSEIDQYAPNAIVIVVTNPLDVITTAIQKLTQRPASKVIGTGTLLDTARLIKIISWACKISPYDIQGYVVGEHGNSSVVLNSNLRILGMSAEDYLKFECHNQIPIQKEYLEQDVRDAGFKIFRGKGYTSSGVAAATARIVFDIVNDTHRIYPVSTVLKGEYGINGFAISVPCMIGKEGIEAIKKITMNAEEQKEFASSAAIIEKACRENNLI